MHTKKGYIVPAILIILLLILAGVFVFMEQTVESPIVQNRAPAPVATTTPVIRDDLETSSASTSTTTTNLVDEISEPDVVTSTTTVEADIEIE